MITINDWVTNKNVYVWFKNRVEAIDTTSNIFFNSDKKSFEIRCNDDYTHIINSKDVFKTRKECIENQIKLLEEMLERE